MDSPDCPSGAIRYVRRDGKPQEAPPIVNLVRIRQNGPLAVHAEVNLVGHGTLLRATLCRCGKSKNKPFCDNAHVEAMFEATGEPLTQESKPLAARAGVLTITPAEDGPLLVNGNVEIVTGTGRTIDRRFKTALCRCGGSRNKPFCDGTHASNGFTAPGQ
jgi:CDGSH-type Zn-finger protein